MESASKHKIMLVDDDTFLLNMYSLKFSKAGNDVTSFQSGSEALKQLRDGYKPDIIVMDIIMPGMDGLETLSAMRKENLASDATVVMLTNQSDTSEIDKAKNLGINGYIVKATTIPSEVVDDVVGIHKKRIK